LALIETTTHLKRQNQLRWRMERKLSSWIFHSKVDFNLNSTIAYH
jgi:protein associated with RNAse G/E